VISIRKRTIGFVEHPSPEDSDFLNGLGSLPDLAARRASVRSSSSSFTPFQSVVEIKSSALVMYEFSLWLEENKDKLDRTTLDDQIPDSLPSSAFMLQVWDNVYYDILEDKNPYIRQACLQMLVGYNFAANYLTYSPSSVISAGAYESEMNDLKRLANAKVVVDQAFSEEKVGYSYLNTYAQIPAPRQLDVHTAKLAALRIPVLKSIKEELKSLAQTYQSDYAASYSTAKTAYESAVETTVTSYLAALPLPPESTAQIAQTKILKQESAHEKLELQETKDFAEVVSIEQQLPEDLVANFSFEFDLPLSDAYRDGKLSLTADGFIQANRLQNSTVDESLTLLDKQIADQQLLASKSKRKQFKEVLFNGVQTRRTDLTPSDFALSIHAAPANGEIVDDPLGEIYFSLNTGYNGAIIQAPDFMIVVDGIEQELTDVKVISARDQTLFLRLSGAGGVTVPEYASFSFQAKFELDNGNKYRVEKLGYNNAEVDTGIAVADAEIPGDYELYGVSRIGVVDYKRVEQELCCYVPGEVSHIENILAREYKEKSTRRLLSSESITQTSTEREIEESTDTSMTSRFELSSEISEVLQRDRNSNFGFSTGASGEILDFAFNASAHGDFSFGQSTTESNAIARNYAEDVTRRALERIVQRVMVSRTSRILQEFEENNRHGYDNREGTEHVTGVFRWIDKVYKNQIVNYNKRLLYEFMLPEPARFYKDAIIMKAEEEEVTTTNGGNTGSPSVGVKPDAPSVHGINNANDIKRDNYQQICSLYGVNAQAPLDQNLILIKSYAQNIGGTDVEKSFTYPPDMMIPTEYEGCNLEFTATYQYTARTGAMAYIRVTAAGQSWASQSYRGFGSATQTVN
jgi:hypothetical protein